MDKVIEIKNLSFNYPDGHQGLKNADLNVYPGENMAVIGPNGAGKSTLLLRLNGILRGNSTVKICGLAVEEKNLKEIRKKVGLIFQNPESLVIDEPTSNLDPRSKWSLIELLMQLPMTKIIATHDLELVRALCGRTVVMDEGKIVADGNKEDILDDVTLLKTHGLAH